MTGQEDIVYLVHFKKPDGKSLFLSPFNRLSTLTDNDRKIQGLFGNEPDVESISHVRELLYAKVDIEVRRRLSERRFIPKFVVSALVFLVMYFFLGFALRNALPIVDEAIGATVAAVLCFIFIGRRDEISVKAADERARGRARVDAIAFEHVEAIASIENAIQRAASAGKTDIQKLCEEIRHARDGMPAELQKQVRNLLEDKIRPKVHKQLPRRFGETENESPIAWNDLKRWCDVYRVDPSLVMLYLAFNTEVARNR